MNIVLVSVGNFQEYILTNIRQLIRLGHKNIHVITDKKFFEKFFIYDDQINLWDVDGLHDEFNYMKRSTLDRGLWNGFWALTSARFFYIHALMKREKIFNVLHLENDVLIYYNADQLLPCFQDDNKKVWIPFDSFTRNIASIVFIPDSDSLGKLLDRYDYGQNDMYNFRHPDLVENFPILAGEESEDPEVRYVCRWSKKFPYVFDAAAIGQYVGGVDPRNIAGSTVGFVNETSVIKYNQHQITFDSNRRPILDGKFAVFNLHIHCKDLEKFVSSSYDNHRM